MENRMNPTSRSFLSAALLCSSLGSTLAMAEDRPITGKNAPAFAPIDLAVLKFMDTIGCQTATIAISEDGRLVYSRGYGWSDEHKTKPVPPDALMRIASVTKPITAAAIKNLVRSKQLALDAKAFELIEVNAPGGKVADPRVGNITVGQLLEHKGGWDRDAIFDPMFRTKQIEKELKLDHPATPVNVIEYMLTRPLQFTPGEKSVYSNFGYCVLGRVLEKTMKKPYSECIQQSICKPLGINDIKPGHGALTMRDAREVWYPVAEDAFSLEVLDANGGLIASAPALCQFLQVYWLTGDRRMPGERMNLTAFGSLPGTTAMVCQRPDGVNVAVLFNRRRDKQFNKDDDSLKQAMDEAIEKSMKRQ
jgi:CubicO group peptidase (beta-lactamase class C family)